MSTAASAVATVDSATTQEVQQPEQHTPSTPAFDAADQRTWSGPQREHWNKTGEQPTKADSATASEKKDTTKPDSSTGKEKPADTASDSATDKDQQKPHLKTKEDTDKRFKEILDEIKTLRQENETLKRTKNSDTRDIKQESQPAAEAKVPPLKKFLDEYFVKPENKGKPYEDGVEAWQAVRDQDVKRRLEQEVRQQLANEQAQRELNASVEDAKKRYPDYETRTQPALQAILSDQQIPYAVKATINSSPVVPDLLYVLAEPAALADLMKTAKSNPAMAIRKIVLTEQLVMAELAKANGKAGDKGGDKSGDKGTDKGSDGKERDASGKFVSSEKEDEPAKRKPLAPKPPSEVGGRGTASEDVLKSAAAAGDFKAFEAEQNRRMRAQHS